MNSSSIQQNVLSATLSYVLGIAPTHIKVFDYESFREKTPVDSHKTVETYRAIRQSLNSLVFGYSRICNGVLNLRGIDRDTWDRAAISCDLNKPCLRISKEVDTRVRVNFEEDILKFISKLQEMTPSVIEAFQCFRDNRAIVDFILSDISISSILEDISVKINTSNYPFMIYMPMCTRVKKSFKIPCMFSNDVVLRTTLSAVLTKSDLPFANTVCKKYGISNKSGKFSVNGQMDVLEEELCSSKKLFVGIDAESVPFPYLMSLVSKINKVNNNAKFVFFTNNKSTVAWDNVFNSVDKVVHVRDMKTQTAKNFNDMRIFGEILKFVNIENGTDVVIVSGDIDMLNINQICPDLNKVVFITNNEHFNHQFVDRAVSENHVCLTLDRLVSGQDLMEAVLLIT